MRARLLKFLQDLSDAFWVLPALLVVAGSILGAGLVEFERAGLTPDWLLNRWVYGGGETGARTLLGSIAGSSIAVAGTIFSITIAALTLASQQMGPRLLRNFTRDRGAQWTLGVLLGAFAYSLLVLRSVRGDGDAAFVPHLAVTGAIVLAFWCIAMLVYFVHHMSTRINVDTVIELVHRDLVESVLSLTEEGDPPTEVDPLDWTDATEVCDLRSGYLQQLDIDGLADWACEQQTHVRLLVRPGDYLFPGAALALVKPHREGALEAIREATALGANRASSADLTYTVRQLVEVAVRALSPGINDPMTAISVLDRLGDALCRMASRRLAEDKVVRDGRVLLVCAPLGYDELCGAMFDLIRQNAARVPAVLSHMVSVLTVVSKVEDDHSRLVILRRHLDAIAASGRLGLTDTGDREAFETSYRGALAAARSENAVG